MVEADGGMTGTAILIVIPTMITETAGIAAGGTTAGNTHTCPAIFHKIRMIIYPGSQHCQDPPAGAGSAAP